MAHEALYLHPLAKGRCFTESSVELLREEEDMAHEAL
jgi:hypothetical protein